MIEVKDIINEYEYKHTLNPILNGKDKQSVIENARKLWGDNFKIGLWNDLWLAIKTRDEEEDEGYEVKSFVDEGAVIFIGRRANKMVVSKGTSYFWFNTDSTVKLNVYSNSHDNNSRDVHINSNGENFKFTMLKKNWLGFISEFQRLIFGVKNE
jgi:hypothetical protein